jgi:hypothetical protein
VLTGIGILLVRAQRLFHRVPSSGPLLRLLPVASAVIITVLGGGILAQGLAQSGALEHVGIALIRWF